MRNFLYDVVTLFDCMQDPATRDWFAQLDLPVPDAIPPGRYPSPTEIQTVLESITGVRACYLISDRVWQANLTSQKDVSWACMSIKDYCGDPDSAHRFVFTAGWDEMILLASTHLAKRCGPLVLLPDSGSPPRLVY
mgnify:CR=1 FL=1